MKRDTVIRRKSNEVSVQDFPRTGSVSITFRIKM